MRTGRASADHPRAGTSILSAQIGLLLIATLLCSVLTAVVLAGSESQPRHSAARARKVVKPIFLMNVIVCLT